MQTHIILLPLEIIALPPLPHGWNPSAASAYFFKNMLKFYVFVHTINLVDNDTCVSSEKFDAN